MTKEELEKLYDSLDEEEKKQLALIGMACSVRIIRTLVDKLGGK